MKLENIDVTVGNFREKAGIGEKSGKPYEIVTVDFMDTDGETLSFNLDKGVLETILDENKLDKAELFEKKRIPATISFNLRKKGYDCSGTITELVLN